jgi:hypothetical protein
MPSFPVLPELKVFLFSKSSTSALVSQSQTRSPIFRGTQLKDQPMKKFRSLALAGLFVLSLARSGATTITENFSTDPLQNGWQVFGDTSLFQWNSEDHNLAVIWDSSKTNSFFYHPLGYTLTTNDDFSLSFDLRLDDVQVVGFGTEIAISLFKLADATRTNFDRVIGADAVLGPRNIAEFDYFPGSGGETVSPTMISGDDTGYDQWASGFFFPDVLTNGVTFHVALTYTATNQSLATLITYGDNQPWTAIPSVPLTSTFKGFQLDAVAVSSYCGNSDPFDSTRAQGIVGNLTVTLPPPPVQNLTGGFSDGNWQVQFISRANWLYTLQRTPDFQSWTDVSVPTEGNGTNLFLSDTNPPTDKAFYRVSAQRP